jgi:DNA polymerase-3 subunit delta
MGAPVKADDLLSAWSRGKWDRLYFFAGPEDFLIDEAVKKYVAHVLKGEDASLNYDQLDADSISFDEIIQICRTVPFLGASRLVVVRNAGEIASGDRTAISQALSDLPSSTYLVFTWLKEWRRDDINRPLLEAVSEKGQVVIFWPLFPEAAQRWLMSRAKTCGKTISQDAAAWLVQQAGEGLRLLDQELQKASCFVGERPDIGIEDVQAAFGYDKALSPYEWLARIRQRKGKEAVALLKHLLQQNEEPIRLLAMLSGAVRDWLTAKNSGDSPQALAARFRLRRGEENQFFHDLNGYSENDLMEGLTACVEADASIKTGKENPEMALTLLTLRFCRF